MNTDVAKKSTMTGVLLFFTFSSNSSMLWTLKIFCALAVVAIRWTHVFNGVPIGTNLVVKALNIVVVGFDCYSFSFGFALIDDCEID